MNNIFHTSFISENVEITLYFYNDMYIKDNIIPSLPHMHAMHEMFIILKGKIDFEGNFDTKKTKQNDICIIPPLTLHSTIVPPKTHTSCISVFFTYRKTDTKSYSFDLFDYISHLSVKNHEPIIFNAGPLIISNLEDTVTAMQNKTFSNIQKLKTTQTLSLIFINMCENLTRTNLHIENLYKKSIDFYLNILYFDTIISKHSSPERMFKIDLKELEFKLFLSSRQIENIFKSEYDMTMKKYNNILKMEFAAFVLRHLPRVSVPAIAAICNYASLDSFYMIFKKYFNTTPRKYKLKHSSADLSYSMFNNAKNLLNFGDF